MKKNSYFEEFERVSSEWTKAHEAHRALKQQIIEEKGCESEELKAWYAEEEQMNFPYGSGACKAYFAWKYSKTDEVLFDDFVWDKEAHDFIDTFRKAGIETFVVTNQSTALMENLHLFAAEGCTMLELCTVTKEGRRGKENTERMGVRFSVN